MLKQYQKAIDAFTVFIEIDPDNAYVYKNRGVALTKLKNMTLPSETLKRQNQCSPI